MKKVRWEVYAGGNFVLIGELGMKEQCDATMYLAGNKTIAHMNVDFLEDKTKLTMRRAVRIAREIVDAHNKDIE